jgi:hypothetical protein
MGLSIHLTLKHTLSVYLKHTQYYSTTDIIESTRTHTELHYRNPTEHKDTLSLTCTMVSRFCRDVDTVLMLEAGLMVTTVTWCGVSVGAGTMTGGW